MQIVSAPLYVCSTSQDAPGVFGARARRAGIRTFHKKGQFPVLDVGVEARLLLAHASRRVVNLWQSLMLVCAQMTSIFTWPIESALKQFFFVNGAKLFSSIAQE